MKQSLVITSMQLHNVCKTKFKDLVLSYYYRILSTQTFPLTTCARYVRKISTFLQVYNGKYIIFKYNMAESQYGNN